MKLTRRPLIPILGFATSLVALGACGGDPATSTTEGAGASTTSSASGGGGANTGGSDGGLFQSSGSGGSGTTTSSTSTGTPDPGAPCESQNPTVATTLFSKKAGAAEVQSALGVAADAQGNILVAGAFQSSIDFGAGALNSAGLTDAYVAKLNSNGVAVWAKSYGDGSYHQYAQHIAADPTGNVLVTGHFRGSINFGGGALTDVSNFFEDLFVAKLDPAGNHVWSKRYGDINNEESQSIASDAQGNVVVAGAFQKTINFGGGAIVAEDGGFNAFVAKLSPAGDQQWAKSFGDTATEQKALGVTTDATGNVYLVGYHKSAVDGPGTIDFGGGTLTAAMGEQNAYVAKFSPTGTLLWAKSYGAKEASAVAVAVDAGGNVFALGNFKGTVNFGGEDLTAGVANNVFLVKLDKDGAHLWSRSFGENNQAEEATAIVLHADKPVVLGTFTSKIDFGGGSLQSGGGFDVFLAKLDEDGCQIHASAYGGAMLQRGEALAVDGTGNTIFGGSFDGTVDFGTGALTATATDAYIVKIKP